MRTPDDPVTLPLRDAFTQWTDPLLLKDVVDVQAFYSGVELREMDQFAADASPGRAVSWRPKDRAKEAFLRESLKHAWVMLTEDFRRRIQASEIYLFGVPTAPARLETRTPIVNAWAADYKFDFFRDIVTIEIRRRFVAVTASRGPGHAAEVETVTRTRKEPVRPLRAVSDLVESDKTW